MKILKLMGVAAIASLFAASTASATIVLSAGNVGGTGVHADGTQTGTTVFGTVGVGGELVKFTSSSTLALNGTGEAIIQPTDATAPLNDLTVSFLTGKEIVGWNVELPGGKPPANGFDMMVLVNGVDSFDVNPLTPPQKYFLTASGGDEINTIAFTFSPGVKDMKQFRVTGFAPVPEPATWAAMLLGFGAIGAAMRRRHALA
jgi:hypothetical protein